ncbi:type VII secretion protein EccCa [Mycobacterium sp. 21AC1]|uniref:type VII secretion protein EccCa n=1 Tax=[Mycobacterium] appelbergii TaxID=2939269 RepID=UPI002939511A|nr:type VII secretion protein EccCa [Mycobacterium sp. 21AC1]MDV3127475.1 type VII secretion protein EccCa [Mycobacterium sp. 21AC1]
MDLTRYPLTATNGEVSIDAPPPVPRTTPANPLARLLPLVVVIAMVGMMAVYFGSGAATSRGPMVMFFPVMMLMSVVGTLVYSMRGTGHAAELSRDRREYLCYLDGLDRAAGATARAQWVALHTEHPEPGLLWTLAGGSRMWERTPADTTFGEVRVGVGDQPLRIRLVAPEIPQGEQDPVTTNALQRLLRRRSTVAEVPITVQLCGLGQLSIGGDPHDARGLLRAMICGLAVLHSPADLQVVAVLDALGAEQWDWLKWLPHHRHPDQRNDAGAACMRYRALTEVPADGRSAHRVVIMDAAAEVSTSIPGATVLSIRGAPVVDGLHLHIDPEGVSCKEFMALPDGLTAEQALTCARRLTRHRPVRGVPGTPAGWAQLIGVGDPDQIDPATSWRPPHALRVPIGVCERGAPVYLDLKEAAQGGMGPHGLCVGATGSGKSELLRTLTLGLIAIHPPEALNLILVDFKGGATFLGLDKSRHVSALITNLADEAPLVARMGDALAGEMTRRQELLRAAGNLANITEYRQRGSGRPPLPALLIVVDEFSELLHQHPDFAELFVAIGRLGRSLGMHLLLASQRLDEGRLRGLETHLSYRICLKTFSPNESRSVLGVTDAYHLPNDPGVGYLKTPSGEIIRFQTAFVSGGYHGPSAAVAQPDNVATRPFEAGWAPVDDHSVVSTPAVTMLDTVVSRLTGHGTPAHQVWLPPLPPVVPLSDVLMPGQMPLTVAVGLIDCPFEQRRDRLVVRLDGAAGNVAIVGGPHAGKSTAARTFALALAATHDPRGVQLYCLDFGGGALTSLQSLPHIGCVAGRRDVNLVRRTVAELQALLRAREGRFREVGVESMAEYRALRAGGGCDDPFGDVFLIVDGWTALRQDFDELEGPITTLAAQGLSFGIHVVATASRWADFRPALKDQLGTRIELRLGDPAESEVDRKRARQLGQCPPGRGLTRDGRELLIAVPRLDGTASATGLVEAMSTAGQTLRSQHADVRAPAVRLLPAIVTDDTMPAVALSRPATQVVLGLGERELRPMLVDFAEQSDLMILGEAGCGKTTALRALCSELARTNDPANVQMMLVDFRRTLLGAVDAGHLSGYAVSAAALTAQLTALRETLQSRMPGAEVTQDQLRTRSWWTGPELYVVVDDYDLVAGAGVNPLTPLLDHLPHARDLGLHLVVARRSGGAARAMFDPVLARLRELGCMGLVMSASPEEGVLLGAVRPTPLPPGRGTLIVRTAPEQLVQVRLASERI